MYFLRWKGVFLCNVQLIGVDRIRYSVWRNGWNDIQCMFYNMRQVLQGPAVWTSKMWQRVCTRLCVSRRPVFDWWTVACMRWKGSVYMPWWICSWSALPSRWHDWKTLWNMVYIIRNNMIYNVAGFILAPCLRYILWYYLHHLLICARLINHGFVL